MVVDYAGGKLYQQLTDWRESGKEGGTGTGAMRKRLFWRVCSDDLRVK